MCVAVQLEGAWRLSHLVVSTNPLFQHQDLIAALKKKKKVVVGGGRSPVFGQMIISERAKCILLADCMEKPFSGPVQRILTSNSCVAEKAGRSFSPPCSGPSIRLGHVVMRRAWLVPQLGSVDFCSERE